MAKNSKQDTSNEPLFLERSYVRSISAGMRLPLRHPIGFLRHLWPLMVLSILVWALVSGMLAHDLWQFQLQAFMPGLAPADLLDLPFMKLCIWGALGMLLLGVLVGQTSFLLHRYGELNYLPAVQPWHVVKDILPHVVRGIVVCLLGYVVAVVFAGLSLFLLPSRGLALLVFAVLTLIWTILYVPAAQHYMMTQTSPLSALVWPYKNLGSLGSTSAILVVCGLLVAAVIIAGCIPALCATYVGGLSDNAVAIGDGTDIPSSFSLVRAISFALAALIANIARMFMIVPMTFHHAQYVSKE